jgi:hypothetical protein
VIFTFERAHINGKYMLETRFFGSDDAGPLEEPLVWKNTLSPVQVQLLL